MVRTCSSASRRGTKRRPASRADGLDAVSARAGQAVIDERQDMRHRDIRSDTNQHTRRTIMSVIVKFTPNDRGIPSSKLADAELHFTSGELDGLKLIGFSVWERRGGRGRSVSFPGRQYRIGDERRTFALLRPIADVTAQERVRDLVLDAYTKYEHGTQESF